MSEGDSKEAGLAMLLVDVLSGDDEDIESLLAYARDPESLSARERQEIERRIEASPAYADQLRVLKRMGLSSAPSGSDPD